jgi:hypothetical protein
MNDTTTLNAALRYAARGWSIIPITPNSKRSAWPWKSYQERPADEEQIRRWFGNGQPFGIAVVFGDVSGGLVCRDFDTMEGYHRWAANHRELAATLPTVATARGRHIYFRAHHRGIVKSADGELRGAGYCLLPPSQHPDGPRYEWLVPLPEREIPFIADVGDAGLFAAIVTETTQGTEAMACGSSVPSVGSAPSIVSVTPEADVRKAIDDTLPKVAGRRNRQVFEFARALRAIPRLADAVGADLEPYVREWHRRALPHISTQPFEETMIDFIHAWPKIRFPRGSEPMALILERVKTAPLPVAALRYEQGELRLLVSLCRELQRESGRSPFYLACRTAAMSLRVTNSKGDPDHVKTWRWLCLLVAHKVLEEVEKGDRLKRRASRYRYMAD